LGKYNPVDAYKEIKIKTASQGELILMLYDEAIKQIDIAIDSLSTKTKHLDRINNAIIKAQDIITELMVSLDFDRGGGLAKNLFSLYMFFNQQLLNANIKKSVEPLKHVKKLMGELRSSWRSAVEKVGKENDSLGSEGVDIAG